MNRAERGAELAAGVWSCNHWPVRIHNGDSDLTSIWLAAACDPAIVAALEAVYTDLAAAVEARGPVCWASGRCCNFEAHGHRLYVTGLEAAYTLARLSSLDPSRVIPTDDDIAAARARGGCPFQHHNLCSVHTIRPLGCRIYFCDRSAQEWQHELSERLLADIRRIHDQHAVPYRYGEWRDMLAEVARGSSPGRTPPPPGRAVTSAEDTGWKPVSPPAFSLTLLPPP